MRPLRSDVPFLYVRCDRESKAITATSVTTISTHPQRFFRSDYQLLWWSPIGPVGYQRS